jgi:hypothetical protein
MRLVERPASLDLKWTEEDRRIFISANDTWEAWPSWLQTHEPTDDQIYRKLLLDLFFDYGKARHLGADFDTLRARAAGDLAEESAGRAREAQGPRRWEGSSAEELGVRAEADELEPRVVGLAVDEQKVAADVALAAVVPVAGERVISVCGRQGLVGGERGQDRPQEILDPAAEDALRLALEVPPEGGSRLNASRALAHSGRP